MKDYDKFSKHAITKEILEEIGLEIIFKDL